MLKQFFFIPGYTLIVDKGWCELESGEFPYQCCREEVSSQILCEDHCSSWTSCIAYDYLITDKLKICCLTPSERSCPSGFITENEPNPIASSMNELRGFSDPNYVCYGKA